MGSLQVGKKKAVSSMIGINGLMKKMLLLMFVLTMVLLVWATQSSFGDLHMLVAIVPHLFIWLFIILELISIVENSAVIFGDSRHWMVFSLLDSLSKKVFNLALEKLKEKGEQKIKDKFDKI